MSKIETVYQIDKIEYRILISTPKFIESILENLKDRDGFFFHEKGNLIKFNICLLELFYYTCKNSKNIHFWGKTCFVGLKSLKTGITTVIFSPKS